MGLYPIMVDTMLSLFWYTSEMSLPLHLYSLVPRLYFPAFFRT